MADGLQISVRDFKASFFDVAAIEAKADTTQVRELSRLGAFTRQRMKSLIRYRKKASVAPDPPSAHRDEGFKRTHTNKKTGVITRRATSPLKELIYSAHDRARGNFVVGPAKFGPKAGIVPPTLEKGGPAAILTPVPRVKGPKASIRQSESFRRLIKEGRIVVPPREYKVKTYRMAARPFVRRAGEDVARSEKAKKGRGG